MERIIFRAVPLLFTMIFFVPALTLSAVIYVDEDASGTNTGTSWANAFVNLQSGLTTSEYSDEVWVAEGTYIPSEEVGGAGDRYRSFQMKNGVNILGGFNGTETSKDQRDWHAHESTLSCDLNIPGDDSDNCYRVVYNNLFLFLDNTAVLDGFTITGAANSGMANTSSSPTVRNCNFTMNYRGVSNERYLEHTCSPLFYNCTFSNNVVISKTMESGSGMNNYGSSPELINCIFKNNRAVGGSGGGLNNHYYSNPTIVNCIFFENSALQVDIGPGGNIGGTGGGIYNDYMSQPTIVNSVFYGNTADRRGGGVHSYHARNALTIKNSIFWNNTAPTGKDFDFQYSDSPQVIYNDMEEVYIGEGNISEVPLFVDPASGDFHLQQDSPCINAATNVGSPEFDIDYDPRPLFIRTDIGIDEYTGWTENFDSEPIAFTDDPYFSVSGGRLHFNGDPSPSVSGPQGVTWNGGSNPGGDFPSAVNSNYLENFIISTDTYWDARAEDDYYGLFSCSTQGIDRNNSVSLSVDKLGSYSIYKKVDDPVESVVSWGRSTLLSPEGQNNRLSIKKVGPYFHFYINQIEVERQLIEGFHGGGAGVYGNHNVNASFDNFSIAKVSYNQVEVDGNNVTENFNIGTGGFSEDDFYRLKNNRLSFQGNRTDNLIFNVWGGGFDQGYWSPASENTNYFENFSVSVDTFWDGGDIDYAYGLIACTQENTAGYEDSIRFWVTQSGYYLIGKIVDSIWETLVDWTYSDLITQDGITTKVSIQRTGDQFHFSLGNTVVQSLNISGLQGGGIGVESSQYVDVSFDNFEIIQPGIPPTADAGIDQEVTEQKTVTLDGSRSVDDISIASYKWYQLAGPQVSLSNPSVAQPTFTAPDSGENFVTLAFQLRVIDGDRLHHSDITVVNVTCGIIGDVNGDCNVDLRDGIISLQVISGKNVANVRSDYVSSGVDASGDSQVGTEEAVNALRREAGL